MARKKQLSFEELLDREYGLEGSENRKAFETKAKFFALSEMIRAARKEAGLTQQQLADKLGTQKSYISKVENGNCDLRYSTLLRIFEDGFGKSINLFIE